MGNINAKFKDTTEAFYAKVREDYAKMISVKSKKGNQVFEQDYIFEQLAEKYFRSPKTIENIVFNRVAPNTRSIVREPVALTA